MSDDLMTDLTLSNIWPPRQPAPDAGNHRAPPAPMTSLIGVGPRQYLLACEDRVAFDSLKAAFDRHLQPDNPIERMWVDEILDLEWDLHRLRNTRRTLVENGLVKRLRDMLENTEQGQALLNQPGGDSELHENARGCVRGIPHNYRFVAEAIGFPGIDDALQLERLEWLEMLARLENSIHAASRLRDAIIGRLYTRREVLARGRVISDPAE